MPPLTLQRKLLLAMSALLLVMVLAFIGVSRWGLQEGVGGFMAEIELERLDWLTERLQQSYSEQGHWKSLEADPAVWQRLTQRPRPERPEHDGGQPPRRPPPDAPPQASPPKPPPGHPEHTDRPGPPARRDMAADRLMLLDANGQRVAGAPLAPEGTVRRPIELDNRVIGYLALRPLGAQGTEASRAFLARQLHMGLWTGLTGLVLAVLLTWWVGRQWLRPIGALSAAARQVAQGRLETHLTPQGDDELAELTRTFNDMTQQLASMEATRHRWLTDVAHELRTPLAAMRAEIEALQDGVRPFDAQTAHRLHRQVMRLGQLIDDLRLSLNQPGTLALNLTPAVAPVQMLREAVDSMAERFARAGLELDWRGPDAATAAQWCLEGDERRLSQVFMNLLENSLRYTHTGGRLVIRARLEPAAQPQVDATEPAQALVITLDDTPPAPGPHDLPHLFERFYRADLSRSRDSGGSGLGLSIVKTLVEAHHGQVSLSLSEWGGLQVCVTFTVRTTPQPAESHA